MQPTLLAAVALAFAVSAVTTPAGVSGAVVLLPAQVGLLGVAPLVATPTNLLYNIVATPAAISALRRDAPAPGLPIRRLVGGAAAGVVAGAALRTTVLDHPDAFDAIVAAVLLPLGASILLGRDSRSGLGASVAAGPVLAIGVAGGLVGGVYGIGGGSIIAPALVALGLSARTAAPPALIVTLVTSVIGLAAFVALSLSTVGAPGPDWQLGVALGVGGAAGGLVGARVSRRAPTALIRRLLGVLVVAVGLKYLLAVVGAA